MPEPDGKYAQRLTKARGDTDQTVIARGKVRQLGLPAPRISTVTQFTEKIPEMSLRRT